MAERHEHRFPSRGKPLFREEGLIPATHVPPCSLDCRAAFFLAGEFMNAQAGESANVQRLLYWVDSVSTWVGKAFAWMILILMLYVCGEVIKRYALNNPSNWFFDLSTMMYGATFMMCGAYTLAQDGHVRGDFLYGS